MFFKWLPTIIFLSFIASLMFAVLYDVLRKPEWPETAANIKIPKAGWIIAVILAVVIAFLAFVMTRDPLQGKF
jgi:hypothetical protein